MAGLWELLQETHSFPLLIRGSPTMWNASQIVFVSQCLFSQCADSVCLLLELLMLTPFSSPSFSCRKVRQSPAK